MNEHIIAAHTYGAQRVTDPHTGNTVSAQKVGYASAVSAVLLALYGANARDVSPKQATYRYLYIDGDVLVRHGHILLSLTADELARIEAITQRHHRAAVYLWRDGMWWSLPDSTHADYIEPSYRLGPNFDPKGLRPPSPSTSERKSAVPSITVERSQREAGGQVWWWLSGDTYTHRELLKRHGARWSKKRQAWYWIGTELPTPISALVTDTTQAGLLCETESQLLAIFGGRIVGKERASNGDTIIKGENGILATRTTWIDCHDQPETVWVFDLPAGAGVGALLPAIHETLKNMRAIFSISTRKWHFEGAEKVAALDALASDAGSSDGDPCTIEEATNLLGLTVKSVPNLEIPSRLFELGGTVYARHELETTDGKPIPTGTVGTIIRLYHRNETYGWSYDVEFSAIGDCWCFEHELTDYKPTSGIRVTHGTLVPPGAVMPPTDAEMKRAIIEGGRQPEPLEAPLITKEIPPDTLDEPAAAPTIRIIKPLPMPTDDATLDAVQTAIHQTKKQSLVAPPSSHINGRVAHIEQSYVGELTGSITGQVFCYGFATHDGVCVYVNMAGPRMGVEAIRAKLSKGDIVSVVPLDAPATELTAGEGNSGMYHPYLHYLPEARFASLILVHDWAIAPNYGGKSTTFIFRTSDSQATAKLKHHITQLVNIAVFDDWATYLYEAGQRAMLVRNTHSVGGIDLLSVDLDVDSWTRLITGGLEQHLIHLPTIS